MIRRSDLNRMKEPNRYFAVAAIWLIFVLFNRSNIGIGIHLHKMHIAPAIVTWSVMVLFHVLLFGWIIPFAFGAWLLRQKRMDNR
jgi:hypothetical protein